MAAESGAAFAEALLVLVVLVLPMAALVGGLARVGHTQQVGSMAAREAARAAVTAPNLDAWQAAGEAAGTAVAGPVVAGSAVALSPADGDVVAPGGFVIAAVTRTVPLLGWPFEGVAPEVEVTARAIARVDPHRARCIGSGCGDGR